MELKLAKVLNRLITKKRLSIKELSEMSGVPSSTIHEWANGRVPRDPIKTKKLADALEISLNQLLFDEEDRKEPLQIEQIIKEDFVSGTFEITIKKVKERK
ncbi:MAG: helix-turn-helix domain-containing protein [Bacteriovoracaceae bacterium]|nr:helix-turn-helix domain-containing protein [Bacteriovoracaceae bacterium]